MTITTDKILNFLADTCLGISTGGISHLEAASEEQIHYATISYRSINSILDHLGLGPSDTLLDLGCGKGRVVCCAARRRLGRVVGVECIAPLADIARRNSHSLRGRKSQVDIHNLYAQDFDFSIPTAIYMFHPFGRETMDNVLAKLKEGLRMNPREVRIAYVHPKHDGSLRECSWLEQYDNWASGTNRVAEHEVSWWRSRAA